MLLNLGRDCSWFIIHDRLEFLGDIERLFRCCCSCHIYDFIETFLNYLYIIGRNLRLGIVEPAQR